MANLITLLLSAVAGALFIIAFRLLSIIPSRYRHPAGPHDDHIQILVLGDIGRSPRMQYHAISVAKHGRKVDLIGYNESTIHPHLIEDQNVSLYPLAPQPQWMSRASLPFPLLIPCKILHQLLTLFHTLAYATPAPSWIIIQNPPSIPTFHIALLVSRLRGSKVLVDWHNYGHTILAQNPSRLAHLLVPIYRAYELLFGRYLGHANLAVTDAMATQLRPGGPFALAGPVRTLHDRPAESFRPVLDPTERLEFLSRLPETKALADLILHGSVRLIVSSTSWTPDEDFGILLDALVSYATQLQLQDVPSTNTNTNKNNDKDSKNNKKRSNSSSSSSSSSNKLPQILAIITGKGPLRQSYLDKIAHLRNNGHLPGITILSAWLSSTDYASLLACADLGISLHKSSSGVDLPMKVVDMFGAGLPVAAYAAFQTIGELVTEGQNGCGFETASELAEILARLLSREGAAELARLKRGAVEEGARGWDEEWDRVVAKLIDVA